jgi:hypothetical protein
MALPLEYDINPLYQGDDYQIGFLLQQTDDSGNVTGPIDLTGAAIRCQIRLDSGSAIIDTPTITIPTPSNGTFYFTLTHTQTAAYTFSTALYDIEIDAGSGNVTTYVRGQITLENDITR